MIFLAKIDKISYLLYSNKMAYLASGIIGILFIIYCLYNGIYYLFQPNLFNKIKLTTKNITNITMLSAVSVTFTIIISITCPITVFPPVRIAFEGLMVKISGFIFGPIIGLMAGLITDGIVMLFVPSYIHISYIIVIASFGFISGCISSLNKIVGIHKWILFLFTNIFIILFGLFASLITWYSKMKNIELFSGLLVNKNILINLIILGTSGTIIVVWIIMFICGHFAQKNKKYWNLMPIIMLTVINEYWVTTLISAWGDISFFTMTQNKNINIDGYGVTMITRLIMAPVKIIFNSSIIYITYWTVSPLIQKKY